jgi:hypothetical protein
MNCQAYLRSLAARFFHRSEVAAEMEEELRSHIQHRADDLERSGLDCAQAERQARIEFGARERFREECHEAMSGHFFETLLQDVRFALRILAGVVLTMALLGLLATWIPAQRALSVDPMMLLREE